MYGELRIALNNVASQFGQLAMRRIPAIDIGEIDRERFPVERKLLRYIDCQMSRMNYEHAAVCMINWLPELEKMTGYVSRETSLAFKCARAK